MRLKRPLLISALIVAALVFFAVLTVLFIPASEIQGVIARGLAQQGYTMRASHFGKAFPLGIKARNLEISDKRGSLVKLDTVSARISLLSLCIGRIAVHYHAELGKGTIVGDVSPQRNGRFALSLDDVQLEDIPFFRTVAEAQLKGNLHARASMQGTAGNYRGELRLWVKGAVLSGVKISGMPLPDAAYDTIQGMCRVNAGRVNLESFTLQGKGL
jgi:type II secretion system protein N